MVTQKSNVNKQVALVTGSSQGIGLAICESLARRKHDIIMVSLANEGLSDHAYRLRMEFGVDVWSYETDLTVLENCEQLLEDIHRKHLTVYILVNNAGIGSNGQFTSFPPSFYEKQIALNCQTPVYLCRLCIPEMIRLKNAYILNIGSLGAFFHMPHKEVYVASKAFLVSFSRSLSISLKNTSVKVSILCPGSVDSNARMKEIHRELKGIGKASVLQPEEVAEQAIRQLFTAKQFIVPGRINQILYWLNRLLPESVQRFFVDREMRRQEKIKQHVVEMPHIK